MNAPDARGWIAIGLFALTVGVFGLIAWRPELTKDQVFVLLAQTIVVTGLVNGAVSFWFGASKKEPPGPPDPPGS